MLGVKDFDWNALEISSLKLKNIISLLNVQNTVHLGDTDNEYTVYLTRYPYASVKRYIQSKGSGKKSGSKIGHILPKLLDIGPPIVNKI